MPRPLQSFSWGQNCLFSPTGKTTVPRCPKVTPASHKQTLPGFGKLKKPINKWRHHLPLCLTKVTRFVKAHTPMGGLHCHVLLQMGQMLERSTSNSVCMYNLGDEERRVQRRNLPFNASWILQVFGPHFCAHWEKVRVPAEIWRTLRLMRRMKKTIIITSVSTFIRHRSASQSFPLAAWLAE